MKHNQSCADFNKTYPNHCTKCGGRGFLDCADSVPYGMGNVSMHTAEPCDQCLQHGKCPLCMDVICPDDAPETEIDAFNDWMEKEKSECPKCKGIFQDAYGHCFCYEDEWIETE